MPRRPHNPAGTSRWHLVAIVLLALLTRGLIGVMANGRGEMEGLAAGYEQSAYTLAAGYGFVRPVLGPPPEVDLIALVHDLARHGERLSPRNAPAITPARWRPVTLHPPGYAVFGWLLYEITGRPVTGTARVLQAIFDSLACLLVVRIGMRLGDRFVGLLAGYGTAVFLPLAFLVTSRVADGLTPPLFVLAFWMLMRAIESHRIAWWIGCGAVIAALWMLRPDYAALPVFLLAGTAILRTGWRHVLVGGLAMLLTTALLVLPWALRNQRVTGEFTPGATSSGMVLLQSIGMFSNPYGVHLEDHWYDVQAQAAGHESAEDPAAARMFRARFAQIARENPLLVLRSWAFRLVMGVLPPYHWGWKNAYYAENSYYDFLAREGGTPLETVRRHGREILLAYWDRFLFLPVSLLLLIGSVACVVLARSAWRMAVFALLPFAYVVLVHVPLYMTMRMMVPGVFAQLVACGCAIQIARGHSVLGLPARD